MSERCVRLAGHKTALSDGRQTGRNSTGQTPIRARSWERAADRLREVLFVSQRNNGIDAHGSPRRNVGR